MTITFTICWGGFTVGMFTCIGLIIIAALIASWRSKRGVIPKLER